jgi:mRNA interferase MazF
MTSITVLRVTSELHDRPLFRVTVEANQETGLERRSQVMVDKACHNTPFEGRTADRLRRRPNDAIGQQALARFVGVD